MCEAGEQTYWEIIIYPNDCVEQFADFIIQQTSCGIEYLDISHSTNPFAIVYDDSSWQSSGWSIWQGRQSAQSTQIVSRVSSTELDIEAFIESLRDFALNLEKWAQKHIGFCFHIAEKLNADWIALYKDSIQPVMCGRFYIRPSWHETLQSLTNKTDKAHKDIGTTDSIYNKIDEIIINPALAFGSGHHISTSMCLDFLSNMSLDGKKMLDVGCGSGILGIAAYKLGAEVYACDTDEYAIKECQKNMLLNNAHFARIWCGSIAQAPLDTPTYYDVIVANIVAFVVKLLHNDFKQRCAKNGLLILSGILDEYKFDIMETFNDFNVLEVRSKEGWVALRLTH